VAVPYVHWGVLTGFVLSLLFYLYRRARPRLIEVGPHPDGTLRDRDVHGLPPIADDVLAVRMDAAVTYLNAPMLERFVSERVQRSARVRTVLICCTPMNDIDATGVDMLRRLQRALSRRGVALRMSGVKKQVHDVLARTGVVREFGEAAFYTTDRAAIDALARSDQETIA
jgi:sulfate permease, SulP family